MSVVKRIIAVKLPECNWVAKIQSAGIRNNARSLLDEVRLKRGSVLC